MTASAIHGVQLVLSGGAGGYCLWRCAAPRVPRAGRLSDAAHALMGFQMAAMAVGWGGPPGWAALSGPAFLAGTGWFVARAVVVHTRSGRPGSHWRLAPAPGSGTGEVPSTGARPGPAGPPPARPGERFTAGHDVVLMALMTWMATGTRAGPGMSGMAMPATTTLPVPLVSLAAVYCLLAAGPLLLLRRPAGCHPGTGHRLAGGLSQVAMSIGMGLALVR